VHFRGRRVDMSEFEYQFPRTRSRPAAKRKR
jgi:hypothetical protein